MKHIFSLLTLSFALVLSNIAVSGEHHSKHNASIEDHVRQVFVLGLPYEQTSAYDKSVVPTLLNMLNDYSEEAHWANIAVALEMIGGDEVVQPLIEFIERNEGGALSHNTYVAKTSAIMGLGYLVNRTGNKQALSYLIQSTNPQQWDARNVQGVVDYHVTNEERNQDMSQYAIMGLALSGHPSAAKALKALQQPTADQAQAAFQAQTSDLVTDALNANNMIATDGLTNYYRSTH